MGPPPPTSAKITNQWTMMDNFIDNRLESSRNEKASAAAEADRWLPSMTYSKEATTIAEEHLFSHFHVCLINQTKIMMRRHFWINTTFS